MQFNRLLARGFETSHARLICQRPFGCSGTVYDYFDHVLNGNNQELASLIPYPCLYQDVMNLLESIPWIALGFAPTFAAMEAAWRVAKWRQAKLFGAAHVRL